MAATICPSMLERETFGSKPDERDANGFIACWNPDCDKQRWVNRQSIVRKCFGCGDGEYEYDVPVSPSEELQTKAKAFKDMRTK